MFNETFKQRVIDRLITLIKTPNFDETYIVNCTRDINVVTREIGGPRVDVYSKYSNKKQGFHTHPCFHMCPSFCGCNCYIIVFYDKDGIKKDEIVVREYDVNKHDKPNKSYLKAKELARLLWHIDTTRAEVRREVELKKEREQHDRLLKAAKQKRADILSKLDNMIKVSNEYSK